MAAAARWAATEQASSPRTAATPSRTDLFRRLKTTGLRVRPVYHWTAHRIVSHVKLCVLALLLQRAAEIRAVNTWRNLRLTLEQIQAIRYRVRGTTIVQSPTPTAQTAAILKTLKISPPSRILAVERAATPPAQT